MFTGSACRGSEQKMANSTLQSLLREPRIRMTDRAAFVQAVSRLSCPQKDRKMEDDQKCAKQTEKAA
jgi:hypothetical protein